jgi:hypothetical protein
MFVFKCLPYSAFPTENLSKIRYTIAGCWTLGRSSNHGKPFNDRSIVVGFYYSQLFPEGESKRVAVAGSRRTFSLVPCRCPSLMNETRKGIIWHWRIFLKLTVNILKLTRVDCIYTKHSKQCVSSSRMKSSAKNSSLTILLLSIMSFLVVLHFAVFRLCLDRNSTNHFRGNILSGILKKVFNVRN